MNVATDTCILINLLHVKRPDLLGALAPYVFYVPSEVVEEIGYPDQQQAVQTAIQQGWIQQTRLEDPLELQTFARATAQLGKGESACIALAEKRSWDWGLMTQRAPSGKSDFRAGNSDIEHSRDHFVGSAEGSTHHSASRRN